MGESLSDEWQTQLDEVTRLYEGDKLLHAAEMIHTIDTRICSVLQSSDSSHSKRAAAILARHRLRRPPYSQICSDCDRFHELRESLHSKDGWTLSYDGTETKVWYRREEHTSSHSILTEGLIRAPLVNVAALIYEADLYPSLFWYVSAARTLKIDSPSMLRRAAHIQVYAPWPLNKRDVAVYAFAVDALDKTDDNCVVVVSHSIHPEDPVTELVPNPSNRVVRVDMQDSGFELAPESPGVIRAKFLYNVDPHLSFVPMSLINWSARTLCRWSLRTLEARAHNLDNLSPLYKSRISTGPVYEHIRSRLKEYWEAKGISQESINQQETGRPSICSGRSEPFDPNITPPPPPSSIMSVFQRGKRDEQQPRRHRTLSSLLFGSIVI